jgi:hypothetical protein
MLTEAAVLTPVKLQTKNTLADLSAKAIEAVISSSPVTITATSVNAKLLKTITDFIIKQPRAFDSNELFDADLLAEWFIEMHWLLEDPESEYVPMDEYDSMFKKDYPPAKSSTEIYNELLTNRNYKDFPKWR